MVFGLGKKKDEAPAQAQMPPEAMAMLPSWRSRGGGAADGAEHADPARRRWPGRPDDCFSVAVPTAASGGVELAKERARGA